MNATTPVKSTQTTPVTPPVPSTSSIAASKGPKGWIIRRRILVSAIVLLLFGPAEAQSADQEKAAMNFNLGLRYQAGEGVPKDLSKAAELYQKAADQGNADAQASLGFLYAQGEGVPKDLSKAAELYQKA